VDAYAQRMTHALQDLSRAFEIYRTSGNFTLPLSCGEFPEIQRLLLSMGIKYAQPSLPPDRSGRPPSQGLRNAPGSSALSSRSVSGEISQRSISAPLPVSEDRTEQPAPIWPSPPRRPSSSHLRPSGPLDIGRPGQGRRE
jgi:hypothetical protein